MAARTVVALCAVCRGPLHIPAHAGAYHVLCPSCRAAPSQPKLTGNPYPVPALSSGAIALIYPERTERPRRVLRMCMRFGCGARIPPTVPGAMCEACARAGFVRPPPALPRRAPPDVGANELELVYPDMPVRDEPELVYPEDAAQAACAPSSNPPTDGQPTILADNDPQARRCHTPRCKETLPAHCSMNRCVQCSFDDWRRRKTLSINMQRTSSPETTTSTEEREVVALLDDMSDVEQEPSSSSSSQQPVNAIPGWDSDLTDLSSSDSDSDSTSDTCTSDSDVEPDGDTTGLKIRIPLLVTQLPPGSVLQKCGNRRCNIALPKGHRWKACDACRKVHRTYQRMRAENARRGLLGMQPLTDLPCSWRTLNPEPDTPLTSRRCSDCQKKQLPRREVYPWKTCAQCRAKRRWLWHRRRNALPEDIVPHAPAYQDRGLLLSSFEAQLRGFVEGQLMYYCAKLCESGGDAPWRHHLPMVFVFAGEYSIVTGQKGDGAAPEADQEAIRRDVLGVVAKLERVLRATLSPGEVSTVDKGVTMRFTCALELIARLRPPATEDASAPSVPFVKTLSGELEAVVVPDESHHLFHGRRTVLRYRMVG